MQKGTWILRKVFFGQILHISVKGMSMSVCHISSYVHFLKTLLNDPH